MIRKLNVGDIEEIVELEKQCFKSPWTKDQFKYELLENPFANLWGLVIDDKLVGYYDLWIIFETSELANIAVLPEYQHQGYGQQLMNHIELKASEAECETIGLEVRVSNERAIALYERNGFFTISTKPGYYKDEDGYEDAYRMMKGI